MKKKTILIIFIFLFIEGTLVYLIFNYKDNKTLGKSVTQSDNLKIAIMLEDGDTYVESSYGAIPGAGYTLNASLTKCVDKNGKETDDTITFQDNEINVETTRSVSCYVYFDKAV